MTCWAVREFSGHACSKVSRGFSGSLWVFVRLLLRNFLGLGSVGNSLPNIKTLP